MRYRGIGYRGMRGALACPGPARRRLRLGAARRRHRATCASGSRSRAAAARLGARRSRSSPPATSGCSRCSQGELTADRAVEIALAHNRGPPRHARGAGRGARRPHRREHRPQPGLRRRGAVPGRAEEPLRDRHHPDPGRPVPAAASRRALGPGRVRGRPPAGDGRGARLRRRGAGRLLHPAGGAAGARPAADDHRRRPRPRPSWRGGSTTPATSRTSTSKTSRRSTSGPSSTSPAPSSTSCRAASGCWPTSARLRDTLPLHPACPVAARGGAEERSLEELEAGLAAAASTWRSPARRWRPPAGRCRWPGPRPGTSSRAGAVHEREADGEKLDRAPPSPSPSRSSTAAWRGGRAPAANLRMAEQRLHALTVNARSEARAARERLLEARARADYLRDRRRAAPAAHPLPDATGIQRHAARRLRPDPRPPGAGRRPARAGAGGPRLLAGAHRAGGRDERRRRLLGAAPERLPDGAVRFLPPSRKARIIRSSGDIDDFATQRARSPAWRRSAAGAAGLLRRTPLLAAQQAPAAGGRPESHVPVITPNGSSPALALGGRLQDLPPDRRAGGARVRPGLQGQLLGLQRPDARPHDRGGRRGPGADLRREPPPRAHLRALARRPPAQRHGRRRRPQPAARSSPARPSSTSSPCASTAPTCTTRTSTRWCSRRWG